MMVLRCTQKLLVRLHRTGDIDLVESTTRLGDWYGNTLRLGPQQLLIFISEHSRLAVVLPARDAKRLSQVLPDAIGELLADIGIPLSLIDDERARMATIALGRTRSRSLLGTMNDYVAMVRYGYLYRGIRESPWEMMRFLARTPILPLGGANPIDLTRSAFNLPSHHFD
jgi:hypothetical protein